jgi:cystathionine beta-synthase
MPTDTSHQREGCPSKQQLSEIKDELRSKCPWSEDRKNAAQCPHPSVPLQPRPAICDTILDNIGHTPLVRINKITKSEGITCELLAKCEFFNSGGSVKDRIGKRMILDAEASGRIKRGDTLIEATSGNTGIGMALAAAVLGYRMIITLPEKMSKEKVDVLKALGAEIIRTPTEAAFDSPDSHIGVAKRLQSEIPNSHILDQYSNPSNPLAHYEGTAREIIDACEGKIDAIVISAGTGGTITGIARLIKEEIPECEVVGVDPYGSILALPESLNESDVTTYNIEGIGYDFVPRVLDRSVVDTWIKTEDKSSFTMCRRLIREEGLLCGGSAGSAMMGAIQVAKRFGPGQRVVVLFADSVRNYMTKFLADEWMIEKGFMESKDTPTEWWHSKTVADLKLQAPVTCGPDVKIQQAINIMATEGYDQIPVVTAEGTVAGMATNGNILSKLAQGKITPQSTVSDCIYKQYRQVGQGTSLQALSQIFDRDHFAIVVAEQRRYTAEGEQVKTQVVVGVATRVDLVQFISANASN